MGFKTPDGGTGADHNLLSATHLDTTPASPSVGDLIAGTAGPVWSRLSIGATNDFLQVVGGLPSWQPFIIENRISDPVAPAVGQIWLRTDL